jgi:hypothetical protein
LVITNKVKWLLSSRPEIDIYNSSAKKESPGKVLQIDVQIQKKSVEACIKHKLSELEREYDYQPKILDQTLVHFNERALSTFLPISLVFKEIFESELSDCQALKYVKESPPSLNSLYDRLMKKVENAIGQDKEYCRAVLAASCFALRLPSYAELDVLAGLPDWLNLIHCSEMRLLFDIQRRHGLLASQYRQRILR